MTYYKNALRLVLMGKHKKVKRVPYDVATGYVGDVQACKVLQPAVKNECFWICAAVLEGLRDKRERSWTVTEWIEFLGVDCVKEHVPTALRVLCHIGAMERVGDKYHAVVNTKQINALMRVLNPSYAKRSSVFVAEMCGRLERLGLA